MAESTFCPVCNIRLVGDKALFSHGGEGSKARLWARVCRHAVQKGCINDYGGGDRSFTTDDDFGQVETHEDEVMELLQARLNDNGSTLPPP